MIHIYLLIFRLLLIFIITFLFIFKNKVNESFAPNIPNTLQTTEVPADFGSIDNPSSRISGVVNGRNIVIESKGRTVWEPEYSTIWNGRWIYHGTVESYKATLNINTVQFLIIDINKDGEGVVDDQFFNFKINVKNAGANILTGLIPSGKYNGWRATLRLLPTDLAYTDPSRPFPVKMRYFIQQSNTILNLSSGNINNMQGYSTKFVGDRLVLANFLEASGIQTEANVAFSSQDLAKINNNIREQRTPRPIDIANRFLGNRIRSHRLLFRATVNGWTASNFRQLANNRGPTVTIATLQDGRFIGAYNPLSWGTVNGQYIDNPNAFLFDRERQYTSDRGAWGPGRLTIFDANTFGPTFGGGHDFWTLWRGNTLRNNVWTFMDNNNRGPLGVNRWSQNEYALRDLEVFSVTFDNISQPTAQPAVLYTFTTHRFTNAGATGREGPTLAQVRNAYSSVSWAQNSEFLNMTRQGIQLWRVPVTGKYTIRAVGAAGGNATYNPGGSFCRGRDVQLTITLTQNEIIQILVGQQGVSSHGVRGGGGGGTFVVRGTQTPIIVAGGGGGRSEDPHNNFPNTNAVSGTSGQNGGDGVINANSNENTNGAGGTNGNGGTTGFRIIPSNNSWEVVGPVNASGGGGGGLLTNGANNATGFGGASFINGGVGGLDKNRIGGINGGFGGGGGTPAGGGGGGGYSGGGGGWTIGGSCWLRYNSPLSRCIAGCCGWQPGGGGGSYGITSLTDNGATNTGNGFVIITANS